MHQIKQSLLWWCLAQGKVTPEYLVREACKIGYEGVELAEPQYWQLIADHGLKIVSIKGHESLTEGFNRREFLANIQREIRLNLELAVKWNIPNLICFSGNRQGIDDAVGVEVTAEGLRSVAKMAEDASVNLILELLNSKVDHPGYQCDKTAWGVKVCQMVNSPRVKLLYDIYHMQVMEGDIIRTIQNNHAYFAHYHTAGNPGRSDIDSTQELNYPAIMRAILTTGYMGYIGQEFIPKGDPIAALKAAFELCNIAM